MRNDGFNPYSDLLYNSVRALISSADNKSIMSFTDPDRAKVYVYHNLNTTVHLTGIYDGTSHTLASIREIPFIDYDLPTVNKRSLSHYLLSLPDPGLIF